MVALTAMTLTGCSSDITDEEQKKDEEILIAFTPMEISSVSAAKTRGSQTTKNAITQYGMSAAIYPAANDFSSVSCGSYWFKETIEAATGNSRHYWPGMEYRLSFYAYAPCDNAALFPTSKNTLGYPIYQYTVPSAIANQADFITANVINHSGTGITDPVPLSFSHQLSDLRFNVYNQGSDALTVHSISIYGVKYSGTFCEGNNPKWTLNSSVNSLTVNPFTLSLGTSIASEVTTDVTGTTNHFILLPQTVASGTTIFDVDATVSGTRKHFYHTLTSDLTLLPEKSYTFRIILGEASMLVDEETEIQDWTVETKYLTVSTVNTNDTFTQPAVNNGEVFGVDNWIEE